jgi:hypothetical protein
LTVLKDGGSEPEKSQTSAIMTAPSRAGSECSPDIAFGKQSRITNACFFTQNWPFLTKKSVFGTFRTDIDEREFRFSGGELGHLINVSEITREIHHRQFTEIAENGIHLDFGRQLRAQPLTGYQKARLANRRNQQDAGHGRHPVGCEPRSLVRPDAQSLHDKMCSIIFLKNQPSSGSYFAPNPWRLYVSIANIVGPAAVGYTQNKI